ncbi:MAG: four helix bundle protein [Clostridia bacterium]|nr:four helix bundle protein [Clostridia bacterium]
MSENVVQFKSKRFAIRIVRLYVFLKKEKREFTMSQQLLRCGTSIGANIAEAEFAVSKKDFHSKMHIALKECAETKYWLEILFETEYLTERQFKSLMSDCNELLRLLIAITKNTKICDE